MTVRTAVLLRSRPPVLTLVVWPLAGLTLALVLAACTTPAPEPLPEPTPVGTPVASLADSGPGSLREAVASAAPGDTLRLTLPGTLTLSSTLGIDKNLTILAGGVTFDTGGKGRALDIPAGVSVTVQGGTFKGGSGQNFGASSLNTARSGAALPDEVLTGRGRTQFALSAARSTASQNVGAQNVGAQAVATTFGGVIQNLGTLTLENVTVTGGAANLGGGIGNGEGATLMLKAGTKITGNRAVMTADPATFAGYGGGVYNAGTLTLDGGSVDNNTAVNAGGGISGSRTSKTTIQAGSIGGNACTLPVTTDANGVVDGCAGGGVFSTGDLSMTGGSVENNVATYFGGGLAVQRSRSSSGLQIPTLTLSGGTLVGNKATDATRGAGGGLWTDAAFTLSGGTLKGNSAFYGGGIQSWGDLIVTGGSVEGNSATNGGGINAYRPDSPSYPSTFTFGGTASVKGNSAVTGGGLFVNRLPLTMSGGTVEGNTATNTGGGITFGAGTVSAISGGVVTGNAVTGTDDGGGGLRLFSGTTVNLSGGEIRGNTAVKTGGGVTLNGTLNMTGGSISSNTVTNRKDGQGGGGGGVRLYAGSSMTASGGSISGNTAWYGGGVETNGAYQTSPTSIFTLSGATVSGNRAADGNVGGGFFNDGTLLIRSGSVTGNAARDGGGVFNTRVSQYNLSGGSVSGNTPNDVVQGR